MTKKKIEEAMNELENNINWHPDEISEYNKEMIELFGKEIFGSSKPNSAEKEEQKSILNRGASSPKPSCDGERTRPSSSIDGISESIENITLPSETEPDKTKAIK